MGFLSDLISNPLGALTGTTAATRQFDRGAQGGNAVLQQGFDTAASYLDPFAAQVPGLLGRLLSGNLNLPQDPAYRLRLNQGLNAVQNRFAASGSPFSGAAARALNDYAQQAASQEYDARYQRLSDLLRLGYGASSDLADASLRAAGAQAGNLYGAGIASGRATQTGFAQAQEMARPLLAALLQG
jgi:hypothetical protein